MVSFKKTLPVSATDRSNAVSTIGNHNTITIINNPSQLRSLLNPLLEKIVESHSLGYDNSFEPELAAQTEEKIKFNAVKIYADDIRENAGYMVLVEEAINSLDDQNPGAKRTLLWAIHQKYKKIKRELYLENEIDPASSESAKQLLSEHADRIIKRVSDSIGDTAIALEAPIELVDAAQDLIVCYGFINCQILEKPQV